MNVKELDSIISQFSEFSGTIDFEQHKNHAEDILEQLKILQRKIYIKQRYGLEMKNFSEVYSPCYGIELGLVPFVQTADGTELFRLHLKGPTYLFEEVFSKKLYEEFYERLKKDFKPDFCYDEDCTLYWYPNRAKKVYLNLKDLYDDFNAKRQEYRKKEQIEYFKRKLKELGVEIGGE